MALNGNTAGQGSNDCEQPAVAMRVQMPNPLITAKM